jgi:DNA-binding CsgD family transcriptional regulator
VATRGVERVEGSVGVSSGGSNRSMRFIRLNLAEIHYDLGEWDRADEDLAAAIGHGTQGVAEAHANLRRAQLALGRGYEEEASSALTRADELLVDALEPQYIALLATLQADVAVRAGDLDAARAAIDRGIDRIQFCSEDGIRIALAAAVGIGVEAEIAERARDLGEDEPERQAVQRAGFFAGLVEAAAEEADGRPLETAIGAWGVAEHARATGEDDPALWADVAGAWTALERPYPAAVARWRQAQAALGRGDRDAAAPALAEAAAAAERLGADWLAGEAEGLASRARLSLDAAGEATEPASDEEEAPFGLTPRELQVLILVASGATNREIGEQLYMAEKTASVHVSRILTKLDVRGRTEAAAVAHRHGIGAEVGRSLPPHG